MKKHLLNSIKFRSILLAIFCLFGGFVATAQTDSVKWTLNTTDSIHPTNVGNVTGSNEALSSWLSIRDYNATVIPQRIRINTTYTGETAAGWPANDSIELSDVWIDFAFTPKSGYYMYVNSVSLNIVGSGTSNMKANIYISTDPNFTYRTPIFQSGSKTLGQTIDTLAIVTNLDTLVKDGQKFVVRVYPWYNKGATASTSRYICIKNVVIKGTTGSGTPSAPALPVATEATTVAKTSFSANWNAAENATGYYLDVATDNAFNNILTDYNNKNVLNVTTYSITGLTAATTYYYRVRAYNGTGTSGNSNTITALSLGTLVKNIAEPQVNVFAKNGAIDVSSDNIISYVKVSNMRGKSLFEQNLNANTISINTDKWSSGIYIVTIKTKNKIYTKKISYVK